MADQSQANPNLADQLPADNQAGLFGQGAPAQNSGRAAGGAGQTANAGSSAGLPNVIGDFFGSGGSQAFVVQESSSSFGSFGHATSNFFIPSPTASVVGRKKIAENTSPIPRDRIFLNYSYFDNTPLAEGGVDVNRLTPGIEKTFFDGMTSIQVDIPMALTLDSTQVLGGPVDDDEFEFGDVTTTFKVVLWEQEGLLFSGGASVIAPTSDDLRFFDLNGSQRIHIEREAVHVNPFLGVATYNPNGLFVQGFLQVDFDTNGNTVLVNDGAGLVEAGTIDDATFLFADISIGYWLMHKPAGSSGLTGFAPIAELHYNRSLEDSDVVRSAGGTQVGFSEETVELLNLTVGSTFEFNSNSTLTFGYAVPLGGGNDQQFDGELRVLFNWYFGGVRRPNYGYGL